MKRSTVALTLCIAACAQLPPPTPSPLPDQPGYRKMYAEMEECTGVKGDYSGVTFYTDSTGRHLGHRFNGYWEPGSIVIYARSHDKTVILHEMIHDITRFSTHPKKYFVNKCGDFSLGDLD